MSNASKWWLSAFPVYVLCMGGAQALWYAGDGGAATARWDSLMSVFALAICVPLVSNAQSVTVRNGRPVGVLAGLGFVLLGFIVAMNEPRDLSRLIVLTLSSVLFVGAILLMSYAQVTRWAVRTTDPQ